MKRTYYVTSETTDYRSTSAAKAASVAVARKAIGEDVRCGAILEQATGGPLTLPDVVVTTVADTSAALAALRPKDPAAVSLGRKGGAAKSSVKSAAVRANGTLGGRPRKVVTWQAANGESITICRACEKSLSGNWPRNSRGEEYATVSHGLHSGRCSICQSE